MNWELEELKSARRRVMANRDLVELHIKSEPITEEDIKTVLRKYNLLNGLLVLGKASAYIGADESPNKIGKTGYMEPETKIIITQAALAYLANMLLISGANDYKKNLLGQNDDNILLLCNTYSNCLVQPEIKKDFKLDEDKLCSMLIRMDTEQMVYQFVPVLLIARTIKLFQDIAKTITPKKFGSLSSVFEKETGLKMTDYLRLAMVVWATTGMKAFFKTENITKCRIERIADITNEESLNKFIKILKADYKTFREKDMLFNKDLHPDFTRTRFNPLLIHPIIEPEKKDASSGGFYLIPNISCYAQKTFGGLYWWFHNHFEKTGQQKYFMDYFGLLFQEYVGIILKKISGQKKCIQKLHTEKTGGS